MLTSFSSSSESPLVPLAVPPVQAAAVLGMSVAFLANDRRDGRVGIPFVKIGGAVRYSIDDLRLWLAANSIVPTPVTVPATLPATSLDLSGQPQKRGRGRPRKLQPANQK